MINGKKIALSRDTSDELERQFGDKDELVLDVEWYII